MSVKYKEGYINVVDDKNAEDFINTIVSGTHIDRPLFVGDLNEIIFKHELWKKLTPRMQPYYAVRCNNSDTVLRIMAKLGVGFVCVSKTELQQVLSIGVDPSQIIFGRTIKFVSHIQFAVDNNIKLMTFDNKEELLKINNICPDARVLIHIRHDVKLKAPFQTKFGCDPNTDAEVLLKLAFSLKIHVIGVTFEIDPESDFRSICNSMNAARRLFNTAKTMGLNFSLLYINGERIGNPGHNDELYNFSKEVSLAIEEYFPNRRIKVIFEDGSYFVRSAFKLATSVFGIKIKEEMSLVKYHYYMNHSTFLSLNSIVYWNTNTFPQTLQKTVKSGFPSVLWGPTCDSIDVLHNDTTLPILNCGDWIVFNNMGSYSLVLSTNFNGFSSFSAYYLINKHNWIFLNKNPFNAVDIIEDDYTNNPTNKNIQ
uniref:Orn/DAP/Arg decarboxylase 2 N-terminal domain-containing protein n=1 Tax=Photinus pyralis TaxID=7054 RepID=A0A1Y1LBY6_PHOPY